MKIYLCAREQDLFDAWKLYCGHYSFVEPTKQDIMSIKADILVSPANSFGFMTGGIDLHYRNYLGKQVEEELRNKIFSEFNNELLVGQAAEVEIKNAPPLIHYKYLIAAPTMRVPENVSHTLNAFLAAKAALVLGEKLEMGSIVFPGLGTGTGSMNPKDCAYQMNAAINYVYIDKRAYKPVIDLYDESDYMRKYIVTRKWYEVQRLS